MQLSGIAIALLAILILLIAMILIVLVTPITYALEWNGRKPYGAEVRVCWLWRVLSIHFAYVQGKPFFKQVYILGKQKVGPIRDYEDWLSQRVEEEYKKTVDEDDLTETAEKQVELQQPVEPIEPVKPLTVGPDGQVEQPVAETVVEPAKETLESTMSAAEKAGLPPKWWKAHVTNMDLWRQVIWITKKTVDHTKPRDVFVEGRFGLGDPYKTGLLSAMVYTAWPERADHIQMDYNHFHLEGSGHIRGRIVLGVLAWYGTRFVLSRPIRLCLRDTFKFLKANRHAIKQFLDKKKKSK